MYDSGGSAVTEASLVADIKALLASLPADDGDGSGSGGGYPGAASGASSTPQRARRSPMSPLHLGFWTEVLKSP